MRLDPIQPYLKSVRSALRQVKPILLVDWKAYRGFMPPGQLAAVNLKPLAWKARKTPQTITSRMRRTCHH